MKRNKLLLLLVLLVAVVTGAWAQDAKHLISAKYREQTRSLEQPLPYATTIGELFEAVTGEHFSDLISTMSGFEMPLTGISSNNTSVVSIGELNGASTPVTVIADGEATISINFGSYAHGIFVSATSPLYAYMKDGVKDADKWTVKVGEGQAQALPIGGLKGDGSETVTLQYNGRLKVKGVKATSDEKPAAEESGLLSGVFSVSSTKQVNFSKGNLRYASSKWSFFDNQYDYYATYSADAWDKFGWSNSTNNFGMSTSTENAVYQGDLVEWGTVPGIGTGWFTLSNNEWVYLFNTRSASTVNSVADARYAKGKVNGVYGIILFPDTYTHPAGVTLPVGINEVGNAGWNGNNYSAADWTAMETAGCVFLPATGYREGNSVQSAGSNCSYRSSTRLISTTDMVNYVYFTATNLSVSGSNYGRYGQCVRLVKAVSDAPAKEPATVTTAPTGAAIVGVGKTTALVSGGVADGGTLMYAVTTTNTKPTSTDGFSDAVPTAEDITASGQVYVWYYVKGDDTHSDSEIVATAIEVPVAIIWDATNVSDLSISDDGDSYQKEGVTLSCNADMVKARWRNSTNPTKVGINFETDASGGFTFKAPTNKAFTKIEMKLQGTEGWDLANLGTGWTINDDMVNEIFTATWTGSAASTVELLKDAGNFSGRYVTSIVFYLSK